LSGPELAKDVLGIVVRGHFNPAIFSPAWLFGQKLIGAEEYADSTVEVITRELASFRCGWALISVTQDTLQIQTEDAAEFERARDLGVGTLRTLPHTPVGALGINRDVHLSVASEAGWHAIGDALAPKEPWSGTLEIPGLKSLTIWGVRPDLYSGRVQVTVEPSNIVPQAVYIQYNDHYSLGRVDAAPRSRDDLPVWDVNVQDALEPSAEKIETAIEILGEQFVGSRTRAEEVFSMVAKLGSGQ
jgi:hypothetical protein